VRICKSAGRLGDDKAFNKPKDLSSTLKLSPTGLEGITQLQHLAQLASNENLRSVVGALLHSFEELDGQQDAD
jgi:hypothetical protein